MSDHTRSGINQEEQQATLNPSFVTKEIKPIKIGKME